MEVVPELPQDCIEGSFLLGLGRTTKVPHLPWVKVQVKQFAFYGMHKEMFMSVGIVLHIEVAMGGIEQSNAHKGIILHINQVAKERLPGYTPVL